MAATKTIVLASSSPRRAELLRRLRIDFEIDASGVPEEMDLEAGLTKTVTAIATQKARAVAARHSHAIIIGADTIGVLDGQLLGKPADSAAARRMLMMMSGRCHRVVTGLCLVDTTSNEMAVRMVETLVYFRTLEPSEVENYVSSGEPLDKAGAYAIQGLGAVLIEKIDGDCTNVMGLPLAALAQMLKSFGVRVI